MEKEKLLSKKDIYKGKVISYSVSSVKCPNGAISEREMVSHPGGVCILVEVDGKIAIEKQYRFPFDDFIYELPAGKLEKGEDPYNAALRELEEEVGYSAKSLTSYGELYPSVGYTNEIIHLYKGNELTKTSTHLDFDEGFDLIWLSKEELLKMINDNVIKDAKTLIFLLKYFNNVK